MKYIDINQKFTAKVAEYIAKGYTINTATMSGSQGEVAHVDLTDGKQVVRVLLDSFTEYDSFNSLSGLEIVVGTPADKVVPYDTVRYNTISASRYFLRIVLPVSIRFGALTLSVALLISMAVS